MTNKRIIKCSCGMMLTALTFAAPIGSSRAFALPSIFQSKRRAISTIHASGSEVAKTRNGNLRMKTTRLNIYDLYDLNVDSITLQLEEGEPLHTFDGVLVDRESWYGVEREGYGFADFVKPRQSGHMAGMVHSSNNKVYSISTRNDGSVISQVLNDDSMHVQPPSASSFEEDVFQMKLLPPGGLYPPAGGPPNVVEIDIMVVYTAKAMCAHANLEPGCVYTKPNRAAIEAEAMLNVHLTNVALQVSGANIRFVLVHMGLDDWVYGNEQDSAGSLDALKAYNTKVHDMRKEHSADVVVLMTDDEFKPGGGNGEAATTFHAGNNHNYYYCTNEPGEEANELSTEEWDAVGRQFKGYCPQNAYVVVNRNGKNNFAMTHELGHTLDLEDSDKHSFCQTDSAQPGGCYKTLMKSQGDVHCTCCSVTAPFGTAEKPCPEGTLVAKTESVRRILLFGEGQIPIMENAASFVANFEKRKQHEHQMTSFGTMFLLGVIMALSIRRRRVRRLSTMPDENLIGYDGAVMGVSMNRVRRISSKLDENVAACDDFVMDLEVPYVHHDKFTP